MSFGYTPHSDNGKHISYVMLTATHKSSNASNSSVSGNAEDTMTSYSLISVIILSVIIGLLAFITIAGNILVIISFASDRKLRTFGNYFILNLAISDVIVGVLIVVYAPYLIKGCWPLGRVGCLIFLLMDYVVPLTSAWNMALISLDRYWSVTRPIAYRTDLNTTRAVVCMCVPWIAGTFWYGPTVLFWTHMSGKPPQEGSGGRACLECQVEFYDHALYLLISSFVEFLLPFITVSTINILIYMNIRRRSRGLLSTTNHKRTAKAKRLLSRDKKSARSLAILIIVFLVTWGPFEICSFVNPLSGFNIPDGVFSVVFWLLWLNSSINPILYPFLQHRFRVAFVRILCFARNSSVFSAQGVKVHIHTTGDRSEPPEEDAEERLVGLSNISPTNKTTPTLLPKSNDASPI